MKTRWKFLREGMKSENGNCAWVKGEWKHEDVLKICKKGFHCSKEIQQAFSYVQGEILAEVQVKGKAESQADKEVWTDMRVVKAWKWKKIDSVVLSIYAAELCIENFEKVYSDDKRPRLAIEAAKKWLNEPTEENASAAYIAAESAARAADSAADSAAYSAARAADSAAYSAASSAAIAARAAYSAAAYSAAARAADSAAYSAASAKIVAKIEAWMAARVKELEEI